jgi:hypothetical protein
MTAKEIEFDFGFMADDDIYFNCNVWDSHYILESKKMGYEHLSYYNKNWINAQEGGTVWQSQGAFWTFTPKVIKEVGFLDVKNMGFRGIGHIDYSARCCRAGFNSMKNFKDAEDSNIFVNMQTGNKYKHSISKEEVLQHRIGQSVKMDIARDEKRIYIPYNI